MEMWLQELSKIPGEVTLFCNDIFPIHLRHKKIYHVLASRSYFDLYSDLVPGLVLLCQRDTLNKCSFLIK